MAGKNKKYSLDSVPGLSQPVLQNDATAVRNNDAYIVRSAPEGSKRIIGQSVAKRQIENQERIRQERATQARAKRKAELEKKVAQQNRGRNIHASPIQAVMDMQNIQTPEAAELARMNREDEAAQSAYINSLSGLRKASAWLQTAMGASGADIGMLPAMANVGRVGKAVISDIDANGNIHIGPYYARVPKNANYAYRYMEPAEVEDLLAGNDLRLAGSNPNLEAIRATQKKKAIVTTNGSTFNLFKYGAEHGGKKQFSKGQPWTGTTVTHGKRNILAIPGKGLDWYGGRHYRGMQGKPVNFESTPIGKHIDLVGDVETGLTGVNPSQIPNSYIYSPIMIGKYTLGYKRIGFNK